jgi:sec-independent protein translocase protein TatA
MPANLRGWEILIIAALVLLLFGAKRLPDAARGLGRSMRIFKAETKGLHDSADVTALEQVEEEKPPTAQPEN